MSSPRNENRRQAQVDPASLAQLQYAQGVGRARALAAAPLPRSASDLPGEGHNLNEKLWPWTRGNGSDSFITGSD